MSRYWRDFPSYSQPSVNELRMKAASSVANAKKKGRTMDPAIPQNGAGPICQSWWGQAWCENLERYADYANRIDRGKSYVRSGAVIDLKVKESSVTAKVQGRRKTPYKVEIRIGRLPEEQCQAIIDRCSKKIESLEE